MCETCGCTWYMQLHRLLWAAFTCAAGQRCERLASPCLWSSVHTHPWQQWGTGAAVDQVLVTQRALYRAEHITHFVGALIVASLYCSGLLLVVPLMAGVLLAYSNGGVVANPSAVSYDQQAKMCVGDQGQSAMCCTWMPEGWAIAYMSWGMMVVGWTSLLVFTIKVFVISGVTAQW